MSVMGPSFAGCSSSSGPSVHAARGRRALVVVAAQKSRSRKNVCINKTLTARAEATPKVLELCKEMVAYSEQEAADRSKGIIVFQCVRDSWEPNTLHFWERYESNADLGRHNTSPRMMDLMTQLEPLLDGPMGMSMYEFVDGKIGASSVQGGPKGEGGLDDATGASGAAGGASYKQTSATVDLTRVSEHDEAERDQAIMDGMSGASSASKAAAAASKAGAAKQAVPAGAAARLPGGLGGLIRAVQAQAEGFGKCVAHYVSAISGGGKDSK